MHWMHCIAFWTDVKITTKCECFFLLTSLIYVVFQRFQRCSPNLSLSIDVTPVLIIGNLTKVAGYISTSKNKCSVSVLTSFRHFGYILTSKNKFSSSFCSNVISDEAFIQRTLISTSLFRVLKWLKWWCYWICSVFHRISNTS